MVKVSSNPVSGESSHLQLAEHTPTPARAPESASGSMRRTGPLAGLGELSTSQRSSVRITAGASGNSGAIGHSPVSTPSPSPRTTAFLAPGSARSDSAVFASRLSSSITDSHRAPEGHGADLIRSSSASDSAVDIPNHAALAETLRGIFAPHITNENAEQFETLIADRAARLDQKGETPESMMAVLSKGSRFDRVSHAASGFVRSIPFGTASRALDVIPALTSFAKTPAQVGAVEGSISGVADVIGGTALHRATKQNIEWMAARPEQLSPGMAEAAEANKPSLRKIAVEAGAAFQTFSLRNVLRTGVAPLATKTMGAVKAANVDSWIAAIGSPVSGAAAYAVMHHFNESAHRQGPEFLLGRADWEAQFDQLKQATWGTQLKGGAKRAAALPRDLMTDTLQGVRDVFTATNLVKNLGTLGGGFAAVVAAKIAASTAAENMGASQEAVAAVKQAVGTVVSAPVFSAWTTADVMGPAAFEKALDILHPERQQASEQAHASDHVAIDIDALARAHDIASNTNG